MNNVLATNLIIPSNVTYISDYAFQGCETIISLTISDGVEEIGVNAFEYCSNIKTINIPKSVQKIQKDAFSGCDSLKEINYAGTKAEWKNVVKDTCWDSDVADCIVICSDGTVGYY